MKIEKLNENQIRCTLTKEDLMERQLKLSELAYGTEKAKELFRDMMQQASYEYGFEAEDIPLMIEAIPLSSDCIILIITKVDYPEELDTRFSKFSPVDEDEYIDVDAEYEPYAPYESADGILDYYHSEKSSESSSELPFVPLAESLKKQEEKAGDKDGEKEASVSVVSENIVRMYSFPILEDVFSLSEILKGFYHGTNHLYKDEIKKCYYLVLSMDQHTPEEFNKVCNVLSEYSRQEKYTSSTEAYLSEHMKLIVKDSALQTLASL